MFLLLLIRMESAFTRFMTHGSDYILPVGIEMALQSELVARSQLPVVALAMN